MNKEFSNLESKKNILSNIKQSKTYQKILASSAALMLVFSLNANDASAHDTNYKHTHPHNDQANIEDFLSFFGTLLGNPNGVNQSNSNWQNPNNPYYNNNEYATKEQQLRELDRLINQALANANNARTSQERQQHLNELNQLMELKQKIEGTNNYRYNYDRRMNRYSFQTIETTFVSNSNYWSHHPDKRQRMRDLEKHHVAYRFHDTQWTSEEFHKLTRIYQVNENGGYIGTFDGYLSDGEAVLLKFEFGNRASETIWVTYKDRMLHMEGVTKNFHKQKYIDRKSLKNRQGTIKMAVGRGANKDGDGYRMVLFFNIERP